MNLLTRESDNAVRAIIEIASNYPKLLSTSDLEKTIMLPRPFLRKVMQKLSKAGILESIKGNKGGFKLILEPKDIYLIDIIKIYQGNLTLADCLFRKKICANRSSCVIRKRIKQIELNMIKELNSVTIKDFLDDLVNK